MDRVGEFKANGGVALASTVISSHTSSSSSNDDVTVTGRPKKPMAEVTEESSSKLIIP
jgi:hypothetical protein